MKLTSILIQILGCFLLLLLFVPEGRAQSKAGSCNSAIIAMNISPVVANESRSEKIPCGDKGKQINQSPVPAAGQSIPYYNDVPFDQLGKPFINIYPEVLTGPDQLEKKSCNTTGKDKTQKITACSKSEKEKECTPKKETPKRLRPSATVKLVSLD